MTVKLHPALSRSAIIGGILGLTACTGDPGGNPFGLDRPVLGLFAADPAKKAPVPSARPGADVVLAQGDIALSAPEGWCVEPRSLKSKGPTGFALLVGCHALSENQKGDPGPIGAVTITVTAKHPGSDKAVEQILLATVGRSELLAKSVNGKVAIARLKPTAPEGDSQFGSPAWRAIFAHDDRVVSLAAYTPGRGNLAGAAGRELILQLAREIRRDPSGVET